MANINIGKVAPTTKGEWSNGVAYEKLDIVTNGVSSYIAKKDVPSGTSINDENYWQPLATGGAEISRDEFETIIEELDSTKENTILKSASGAIASFDDGVEAPAAHVVAKIEPVQDLHGYDHPWPAGSGKNLLPNCSISGTSNGFTVTQNGDKYILSGNQTAYAQIISSETITLKAGTYTASIFGINTAYITFQLRSPDGTTTYSIATYGTSPTFTLASDTEVKARITSNYPGTVSYTVTLQIESGSTATSYAPYSNICPITGWTGVNVTRTGKNLIDVNNPTYPNTLVGANNLDASNYYNTWEFKGGAIYTVSLIKGVDFDSLRTALVQNGVHTRTVRSENLRTVDATNADNFTSA